MAIIKSTLVILCTLLLLGCGQEQKQPQGLTEVSTLTLKSQSVQLTQTLYGRTKASLISEVRPQVGGIIEQRLFTEGRFVTQGQVLYKINDASYQAAYAQAQAALASAQATLATAKNKYDRYQVLIKSMGVSKQDFDDVTATYEESRASVTKAQATLDSARIDLSRTEIKAPIAGYIGISSVTVGALVTTSQSEALATIRSLDPIFVDITQSSTQLLRLRQLLTQQNYKTGSTDVALILEDNTPYQQLGQLQLQEVAVDESTGSVTLRATFANPERVLLPGMFVQAIINYAVNDNAILIPQRAVLRNAKGQPTVFVINDNKVSQRVISTDKAVGEYWLVTSGITENEQVIVEGINKVSIGETVKVIPFSRAPSQSENQHVKIPPETPPARIAEPGTAHTSQTVAPLITPSDKATPL